MKTRFGIAGTAHWAREVHIPGLLATSNVEVVGVWGRTMAAAASVAKQHGIAAFARLQDMLDAIDGLTIAVDPRAQPRIAVAAANAGKHLILEKPLALDVLGGNSIVKVIRETNVANIVFFIRRFVPGIEAVIEAERHNFWEHADVCVHSAAMSGDSPYRSSAWRQAVGAEVWDLGPHVLSVLIPMLGHVSAIEAETIAKGSTILRTVHEYGRTASISLSLQSRQDQIADEYRFSSAGRELLLPAPDVSPVQAFSFAASQLVEEISSGRRNAVCGVTLGADIVNVLSSLGGSRKRPEDAT